MVFALRQAVHQERFDRNAAPDPDKPVTAEDLVSADGVCPGMAPPAVRRTPTP